MKSVNETVKMLNDMQWGDYFSKSHISVNELQAVSKRYVEMQSLLEQIKQEMLCFRTVANEVGVNDADGFYLGHTNDIFNKIEQFGNAQ